MPAFFVYIKHTTYILYSPGIDRYDIGYTSSFSDRLSFHNDGARNKIWTKRGIPWEVYLTVEGLEKSTARKLELHLKKMKSRNYLKELKQNPKKLEELLLKLS
ncbi:GIY-YIG nuclease family protein [Roseivirga thermotolerans]|uniref:GIY-YIG domain-containing protein n=1 Tax=Roseivirga thermotolerans TaxID=1758176 RepID=A0ABQ3I1Q4_9BACT|nr:GIY-YIG nuclease family protein [Roseivirga thermotolerans]GHE56088.1 hypothetical protein GCM10011340_08720 [Roseivirga thermotolerans]